MLLACAAFLAIGQLLVGPPSRPLPDLVVLAATALVPVVIGVRIVQTPGAASAICGVYLLPASMLSLVVPSIPPPPLLLVPAVAFDLALWLEPAHIINLLPRSLVAHMPPRWRASLTGRGASRQRSGGALKPSKARATVAGGTFGVVLGLVEPPFRLFLGAEPVVWSEQSIAAATLAAAIVCAAIATLLTVRGRAV